MDLHAARAAVLDGALAPWRWPRARDAADVGAQQGVFVAEPEAARAAHARLVLAAFWNPTATPLTADPLGRGLAEFRTTVPPGHVVWAFEGMNPMPFSRRDALHADRGLLVVWAPARPDPVRHDVVWGARGVLVHMQTHANQATAYMLRDALSWPDSIEFDATEVMPVQLGTCMEDARAAESAARARCVTRCRRFKEELMQATWHPRRVEAWLAMGERVFDMMAGV